MGYQRNTVYVMLVLEKEQIRYACPNFSKFPILLLLLRLFIEPYVIVHGQQKKKPICICVKNCCYWRTHYNRIPVLRIFYFRIIVSEYSNDFNRIVLFSIKLKHLKIWLIVFYIDFRDNNIWNQCYSASLHNIKGNF